MGSRFGAAVPKKNNSKLKILLGSLMVGLFLILFVLIWAVQNNSPVIASGLPEVATENIQNVSQGVGVLVPRYRIEAGQKISDEMFKVNYVPENQVPPGAILNHNRAMLSEKYATKLISANVTILNEDVSNNPPLSTIEIPPGYRLITILVDNQSGVDGFAKPGTRVDLNWTFLQDGKKKLASPLVRFVKVVSLGGVSEQNGNEPRVQIADNKKITVSMLMTEKQSQYTEVAKGNGTISLVLVGDTEPPADLDAPPKIFDMEDIIKDGPKEKPVEEISTNVMIVRDDVTGREVKYVLSKTGWKKVAQS